MMKIIDLIKALEQVRDEVGNLSIVVRCDGASQQISLENFEAAPKTFLPWWFLDNLGVGEDETHVLVIEIDT